MKEPEYIKGRLIIGAIIAAIVLLVGALSNCNHKPETKKYYIVREQVDQPPLDNAPSNKIDSVEAKNDSDAYWRGVVSYTASKLTEKRLRLSNKMVADTTTRFDVLNTDHQSILPGISDAEKSKAETYLQTHLAEAKSF